MCTNSGIKLKIVINNKDSKITYNITEHLWNGERISNLEKCPPNEEKTIEYEGYHSKGPKGCLDFYANDNSNYKFRLYFELSYSSSNPRCSYIYQQNDYSMVYPVVCFPVYNEEEKYYKVEYTISKPKKCTNFYHISDTHFSDGIGNVSDMFFNANSFLFQKINGDDLALGLIHTGDICYQDESFALYRNLYLKKPIHTFPMYQIFEGVYLKNLYEGYGNHDKKKVINSIKERHIRSTIEEDDSEAYDQSPLDLILDEENKLHYRWRWHNVHFIHLNLAPIDGEDASGNKGYNALTFLKKQLDNIGTEEPVILCFHYYMRIWVQEKETLNFMKEEDIFKFWDTIKGYNICAMLNGHIHGMEHGNFDFKYNETKYYTNVPCFCAGGFNVKANFGTVGYYTYSFKDDDNDEPYIEVSETSVTLDKNYVLSSTEPKVIEKLSLNNKAVLKATEILQV